MLRIRLACGAKSASVPSLSSASTTNGLPVGPRRIRAEQRHLRADVVGGIQVGLPQHMGQHRRGSRLAMAARDDVGALGVGQHHEAFRAAHAKDSALDRGRCVPGFPRRWRKKRQPAPRPPCSTRHGLRNSARPRARSRTRPPPRPDRNRKRDVPAREAGGPARSCRCRRRR